MVEQVKGQPVQPAPAAQRVQPQPAAAPPPPPADKAHPPLPQDQNAINTQFGSFLAGSVDAEMRLGPEPGMCSVNSGGQGEMEKLVLQLRQQVDALRTNDNVGFLLTYQVALDKVDELLKQCAGKPNEEQSKLLRDQLDFIYVDVTRHVPADQQESLCGLRDTIDKANGLLAAKVGLANEPLHCGDAKPQWQQRMNTIYSQLKLLDGLIEDLKQQTAQLTGENKTRIEGLLADVSTRKARLQKKLDHADQEPSEVNATFQQTVNHTIDLAAKIAGDLKEESQDVRKDEELRAKIEQELRRDPNSTKYLKELQRLLAKYKIKPTGDPFTDMGSLKEPIATRMAAVASKAAHVDTQVNKAIDALPPKEREQARRHWWQRGGSQIAGVKQDFQQTFASLGYAKAQIDDLLGKMAKETFDPELDLPAPPAGEAGPGSSGPTDLATQDDQQPSPGATTSPPAEASAGSEQALPLSARQGAPAPAGEPANRPDDPRPRAHEEAHEAQRTGTQIRQQQQALSTKVQRRDQERHEVAEQEADKKAEQLKEQAGVRPVHFNKRVHDQVVGAHDEVQEEKRRDERLGR